MRYVVFSSEWERFGIKKLAVRLFLLQFLKYFRLAAMIAIIWLLQCNAWCCSFRVGLQRVRTVALLLRGLFAFEARLTRIGCVMFLFSFKILVDLTKIKMPHKD